MAEFVLAKLAESVLSQAVQRISDLLIVEAASLRSVRADVELLQRQLGSLRGFLKDADSKQEHDKRVRELVRQVKDVASDAEDVIDTYILKVTSSYIKVCHHKRIRTQINSVRARIQDILTGMQTCGIKAVVATGEGTSSRAELQRSLRRSSPNDEDDDVINLEGSRRALTTELTKEEDRRCIVSVVGMGGLGKTTLAKIVFNTVKNHFDCSAWVFISQQYVVKDVLIEILTQILGKDKNRMVVLEQMKNKRDILNSLKDYELIDLLKEELEEKRYLVVLDDIWKIEAWDSVKRAFPNGKKGSKIMFTTRKRDVATSADPPSSQIEPHSLTLEESWELLQRKAFPRDARPPEFNELGKEMAQKCRGLPLAVVVLGGLLSTKNSLDEWEKVMRDVNSHLSKQQSGQEYEGVREILALSYYDLPYYLKPCFLYLGNFPEDSEIYKSILVRLWMAEGFILTTTPTGTRGETEETLEKVGEGYFDELIDRCMVQVDKRDHTGKGVKTCRMHDLMRDLSTNKAREESFAQIIEKSNMRIDGSAASRRLVIHPGVNLQYPTSKESNWVDQVHPNLRSLLCLRGFLSLSALKSSNFRMLRVLELDVYRSTDVVDVGNLIHLRNLCLRVEYGFPMSLSSSIGNLHNLHTLHITNKFNVVESGPLRSLKMFSTKKGFPSLESHSSCHSLSKLCLNGKMTLPQGLIHLPQSLTKLNLGRSEMEEDPMPVLENKLPNLRILVLQFDAYIGCRMVCSAHGFPKLDTLKLENLLVLREWIVEKGAMPSLKKLTMENLRDFEMMPSLKKLTEKKPFNAKNINVKEIPKGFEFVTSLEDFITS